MKLVLEDVGVTPEVEELVPEAVAPVLNDASLLSKCGVARELFLEDAELVLEDARLAKLNLPFASWFTQTDLENRTTPCKT